MGAGPVSVNLQVSKFVSLVLVSLAPFCSARPHTPGKTTSADPGYMGALATANRFLNAWQCGDLETGMLLLSDQARRSQTAESVERVFAHEPNRAFEISHGKCERGACRFPVVMLSGDGRRGRRKFCDIVLINAGKNDWAVTKLP